MGWGGGAHSDGAFLWEGFYLDWRTWMVSRWEAAVVPVLRWMAGGTWDLLASEWVSAGSHDDDEDDEDEDLPIGAGQRCSGSHTITRKAVSSWCSGVTEAWSQTDIPLTCSKKDQSEVLRWAPPAPRLEGNAPRSTNASPPQTTTRKLHLTQSCTFFSPNWKNVQGKGAIGRPSPEELIGHRDHGLNKRARRARFTGLKGDVPVVFPARLSPASLVLWCGATQPVSPNYLSHRAQSGNLAQPRLIHWARWFKALQGGGRGWHKSGRRNWKHAEIYSWFSAAGAALWGLQEQRDATSTSTEHKERDKHRWGPESQATE